MRIADNRNFHVSYPPSRRAEGVSPLILMGPKKIRELTLPARHRFFERLDEEEIAPRDRLVHAKVLVIMINAV